MGRLFQSHCRAGDRSWKFRTLNTLLFFHDGSNDVTQPDATRFRTNRWRFVGTAAQPASVRWVGGSSPVSASGERTGGLAAHGERLHRRTSRARIRRSMLLTHGALEWIGWALVVLALARGLARRRPRGFFVAHESVATCARSEVVRFRLGCRSRRLRARRLSRALNFVRLESLCFGGHADAFLLQRSSI